MLSSRPTRTAFALVAVLAAYWTYALVAVPWIEPRVVRRQESDSPDDESGQRQPARTDYQKLLAGILPPGSWELSEPKVIRSTQPQAMLLFKDYRTLPEGRIKLEPCTAIFFPPSRGRAIVLQAPEGAVLNSEGPLDLSRARFGKLVSGSLEGPVTVWSKESHPGAGDDLEIVTRDIQIDTGRIETPHKVRFRYGRNSGSGRHLLIRLSRPATDEVASTAPEEIRGVQSLELLHLDKIVLAPNPQSPAPVEITCRGPLRFDLVRSLVILKEEVDVHRLLADGPSDQLNCELLKIHFGRGGEEDTALGAERLGTAGAERLGTVQRIVAIGHPVTFRSPSQGRQIEVSGEIQYQLPVTGLLGRLVVNGPGRFRGPISEHDPRVVEASWGKQVRLKADGADHVFSLTGGAKVGLAGIGGISSEEMHVWLEEVEVRGQGSEVRGQGPEVSGSFSRRVHAAHAAPPGVDAGAKHSPPTTTIRPQRLMALGDVRIDSPQLTGVIRDRLEAWFEDRPRADERAAPRLGSTDNDSRRPGQQFHVQSDRVRILLVRQGETPLLEEVTAAGNVDLKQIRGGRLRLHGQLVRLSQASSPNSSVLVQGKPARVQADGLTIRGDDIHLDRGKNRLWIEGPGRLTWMMTRDLQGQPLSRPQPIDISWQERMDFDGQLAHFEKSVEIHGQQQRAWASTLDVTLNRRIDFARTEPPGQPRMRQLQMDGGVRLVNRTVEAGRLVSIDHLEVPSLDVNQLTGKLHAAGPGWMSTTRRGGIDLMRRASAGAAGPRPDARREDSLTYLHVTFQQKITGDILRRQVKLHQNVVAVYGPVGGWEEKLPGGMDARPPRRGAVLNCGLLQVTQMPTSANPSGTFELEALNGARIDGQDEEGLMFTALGQHISYNQAKDLLVLRGGGRSDAELLRQTAAGGPIDRMAARKFLYWPSTNRVEVEGARSGGAAGQ